MKAVARYFADTDLYLGGPGSDWPSKDHAFFGGERVCKQAILLNDLTRDLPVTLRWQLADRAGAQLASGRIEATARAGVPTMYPIEFTAPQVSERSEFQVKIRPADSQTPFLPDAFDLQVFPRPPAAAPTGKVLVFDPVGQTAKMLARAGVAAEPLGEQSDLRQAALVVVGKRAYGPEFRRLAAKLRLIRAVEKGLNLAGLRASDARRARAEAHRAVAAGRVHRRARTSAAGRPAARGPRQPPRPERPGRGVSRSDARHRKSLAGARLQVGKPRRYRHFRVPETALCALRPVLECGFDLVDSPLLEGQWGAGRILLCQVDVTSRYGTDPVSTRLVNQTLSWLGRRGNAARRHCACVGDSARRFVTRFGVVAEQFRHKPDEIIVVGNEPVPPKTAAAIEAAILAGATALLLPESPLGARFGLKSTPERLFIGRLGDDPLLAGLNDGDLYLKAWTELPVVSEQAAGRSWSKPGIVARKDLGRGRAIACQIDPEKLGATRGRVKTLRFWNVLLANLELPRAPLTEELQPRLAFYEDNPWEEIPRFRSW